MTGRRIFITGATGFIGAELVKEARAAGWSIAAVTRSEAQAARLRELGVEAVAGELAASDASWHDLVRRADAVVHLAQPQTFGGRVTRRRARDYARRRVAMDQALFAAIDPAVTRRVVYVAGTSYYGNTGAGLAGEDTTSHPRGWGPYLAAAIEALPAHVARGLPIVAAFPGWVYGPGSWFAEYVLAPLAAGTPIYGLAGAGRITSPIHVTDCARALLHLVDAGTAGDRYFLVDDLPVPADRLAELAAAAMAVTPKVRKLPFAVLRLFVGPVIAESLAYENRLSNNKLRSTGFVFRFATCDKGVTDAVARWRQQTARLGYGASERKTASDLSGST